MSAARSVNVTFVNSTSQALARDTFGLEGGIWSNEGSAIPPEQIAPNSRATWESESDGAATGTQGFANYKIAGIQSPDVSVTWDDPFVGTNSYGQSAPPGFQIFPSGGSGDDAAVTFILIQA